jgi:hypothetical protein
MISEVMLVFIISSSVGVFSGLTQILYKSKCTHIGCCSCLDIDRDVETEEKFDEFELQRKDKVNDKKVKQ